MNKVRGQKPVFNALFKRIGIERITKVSVGIAVVVTQGRSGQTQLHGIGEVVQNNAPVAPLRRTTPVALVNDDKVEKIARKLPKRARPITVFSQRLLG